MHPVEFLMSLSVALVSSSKVSTSLGVGRSGGDLG